MVTAGRSLGVDQGPFRAPWSSDFRMCTAMVDFPAGKALCGSGGNLVSQSNSGIARSTFSASFAAWFLAIGLDENANLASLRRFNRSWSNYCRRLAVFFDLEPRRISLTQEDASPFEGLVVAVDSSICGKFVFAWPALTNTDLAPSHSTNE